MGKGLTGRSKAITSLEGLLPIPDLGPVAPRKGSTSSSEGSRHSCAGYIVLSMRARMILTLLLLLVAVPLSAHNGAVAIAVPVEGIVVHGDLSDWPKGMDEYAANESRVTTGSSRSNSTALPPTPSSLDLRAPEATAQPRSTITDCVGP
jgi:hypothetical protein